MKFELEDGGHTIIFFHKDRKGKTYPFPVENADIVNSRGTEKSQEMLKRILTDGVSSLENRMYTAFMGSPIPPYKIKCYCGHVITMGYDDKGYYIEGASEVILDRVPNV